MAFKSIDEIKTAILDRAKIAMENAQEEVYVIMQNVLKQFYAEFTPEMYDRTYQLLSSCVKGSIRNEGNKIVTEVYFDSGLLHYTTGEQPTGKEVMWAAALGEHGAWGMHMISGDTEIFPDSVEAIKRYIFPILKSELQKAGIPVK